MAEKKIYFIRIDEHLVEVSEEVYEAYYNMERYRRTLEEKDRRNGVFSYDSLDTAEVRGVDHLGDRKSKSVEDLVLANLLREHIHSCLELLPDPEKRLIRELYFEGYTEREIAQRRGVSQAAVHKKKQKIEKKLRKLLKF